MKILKLAKSNFVYLIINSVFQFLIVWLVADALSLEANGVYVLGLLIARTLSNLFVLGINSSNIYFYNSLLANAWTLFKKNIEFLLVLIFIASPILYLSIAHHSPKLFPTLPLEVILPSVLLFIVMVANLIVYSMFQAVSRFELFNYYSVGNSLLTIIVILGLHLLSIIDPLYYIYAFLIVSFCFAVIGFFHIYHIFKRQINSAELSVKFKYSVFYSFGLKSHLSNVVAFFMSRIDMLMIGYFISPTSTAIYNISVLFVERIGLVSQSLSTVMYPNLVELKNDKAKLYPLISHSFKVSFALSSIVSILSVIIIEPIISLLFSEGYIEAVNVFYILVLGLLMKSCSRIIAISITAMGKPEVNFYTAVFVLFINICLNLFLIPIYGMYGAALATSISYFINFIMRLVIFRSGLFDFPIKSLMPNICDYKEVFRLIFTKWRK